MAWWQKKLLRYALSRTGLLDDSALDLDNLDITLGKKNVVELKDVGLNIKRISKLAQLPPSLRVETARVLSLRLTVPADIYQSSIVAEVDGVELSLRLEESETGSPVKESKNRTRSPVTARSPQHRKTHRRLPSPPPYDPGGISDDEEAYLPTVAGLAKSFIQEEPVQERRELVASVAGGSKGLEESIASESSESDDFGTGASIGLPGFLAGFLQGIVDRLQITVKNIEATVETDIPGDGQRQVPVTLRLRVGNAELQKSGSSGAAGAGVNQTHETKRKINLLDISLDLLSDVDIFSELSQLPSRESLLQSTQQEIQSPVSTSSIPRPTTVKADRSGESSTTSENAPASPISPRAMKASILTADSDRFADAREEGHANALQQSQSDLDIQPGDDNISWGSRRRKSYAPSEDLWNSMVSEDDLPESLLLERASTPRGHYSRGQSPEDRRKQRDQSPLSKALQSPGSWPRADESPPRFSHPKGPGSWPLEQSRQSMFQSMTAERALPFEDATDNKRAAIEASAADIAHHDELPELPTPVVEDLTVSRMFSHEEAESMYMSAMTHSFKMHVPGGWSEAAPSERSVSPEDLKRPLPLPINHTSAAETLDDGLAYGEESYSTPEAPRSEIDTPRARSPLQAESVPLAAKKPRASKELLHIDLVSILLPSDMSQPGEAEAKDAPTASTSASFHPQGMPGTFSAYSEMAASRHQGMSFSRPSESVSWTRRDDVPDSKGINSVAVEIGTVKCQLDIPSGRLLYLLGSKAIPIIGAANTEGSKSTNQSLQQQQSGKTAVTISTKRISLALRGSVDDYPFDGRSEAIPSDAKVTLHCLNLDITSNLGELSFRVGSFKTFLGNSCLLSLDRSRDIKMSTIITEQTPDIAFIVANKSGVTRRPVTEISLETLPLTITLDLPIIEETFGSFGGLSGVLEIGNSILSESGLGSSNSSPLKPNKGVRFEGDPQYIDDQPELKINARIGGVTAIIQGSACAVQLRTSTVKTVYREQGAVATVEHVLLSGPPASGDQVEAVAIDLATMRIEYLFSPQDKDLERLLSLLTPSKDKYDNDDDILIDTLLRQRRKGAVARASIMSIRVVCHDLDRLSTLSTLADELSKLSAVTKYLPDDERPGLLTLLRVKEFEARVPVSERFGSLHVNLLDMHCAHVGLPALLALSIGAANASQSGQTQLLHSLVPLAGSENLPMVMARMLGDEVDPTIKVKLFNVFVEYSVAVILDLTGMDEEARTEEIVAELAKSVADIALRGSSGDERTAVSRTNSSGTAAKKLHVDLLIHDSAIGLTPQSQTSKALLILSDAYLSSKLPSERHVKASADIRKAGLFVADQVDYDVGEGHNAIRSAPSNSTIKAHVTAALSKQGFVSVGSIMTAKIAVNIDESADSGAKSIDVDVRNELLLLETCADSTQTLIAILNGLTPPTPPSKQPQYLTEPMTIEDMVASFSGDAFPKPERPPETLFDVEEEPEEDLELMMDPSNLDDEDGLLEESTMTQSLYGPIGSLMGGGDDTDEEDNEAYGPETAESLLEEEDPFEMTTTPTDAPLSDSALVRALNRQCKPAVSDKLVDLGNYEIEDLGYDALGGNTDVLSNKYRFNTPMAKRRKAPTHDSATDLPFKVKLRDLHIIWNIYDGYDWQRTRDGITQAVEQVETRAEQRKAKRRQSVNDEDDEESVIGDFLFNSIYIGVPSNHDAQELRRQINRNIDDLASDTESVPMSGMSRPTQVSASGRSMRPRPRRRLKLERSRAHKVAFELKGVSADIVVFPPDSVDVVSSVDLRVKDFEIFDNVPTSTWRKFLTHLDDLAMRELSKPMMHIELLNVRTLENFGASEIVLRVSVLPLRLHVDQDALDFITRFFEFKDESAAPGASASDQPFLQRVEVNTVDLCMDYKPKKVDYAGLRSGHTNEFMNFVILDAANIRLKHAIVYGIKGFEPLHKTLNDVWMPDVKRNQLPTVLAGLAPVRSLVNIGSGVRDVIAIPIREYRKDGRIVRSIQKGAFQFGKTTASELARLGAKVALGTQTLLQGAEGFLTPSSASPSGRPSGRPSMSRRRSSEQGWQDVGTENDDRETRALSAYANQPLGVFAGLRSARAYLEHDLLTARDALIAVQGEVLESSGPGGAAAAVVKHAPTVILRPIIGTSRAVGTALLGVGNQIDRGHLRKVDDKYKRY